MAAEREVIETSKVLQALRGMGGVIGGGGVGGGLAGGGKGGNGLTAGGGQTLVIAIAIIGAIIGGYSSMIAPIRSELDNMKQEMDKLEGRARTELDKAERGLKDLTNRAETVVRQTVLDVNDKLQREAALIEEKSKIQFQDTQRQIELLRAEISELKRGLKGRVGGNDK